ncbi:Ldh family oxidoreductase [Petroclostridium sp. X23]|uniref:Ldh family oxidoreductase n=1 Tax=Petroclostridium sp. X23 TaxID=3045146 RepID=UPI0024AD6BC7|nr:Ldh family oxidoreductase [Petroclostridium sp. X23]WHH57626.1 Ldh family oxidoreductase [Petroclostridium sp. X23]
MAKIIVDPQKAKEFCIEAFEVLEVPYKDAAVVADNLIEGELRGLGSHGLSRMKFYINKLAAGGFNPKPNIKIVQDRPSMVVMDADNSLGAVAGTKAMSMCIEKAKHTGVACAAVHKGNHFGIAAFYSMMALEHNMIGFALCNSVAKMAVYGGIDPVLGTNPISIAVPAGKKYPLVFDAATSGVALGKVMVADIEGKAIPEGWAIDKAGNPTTDAKAALEGAILPFGGYKGSGLAIMVDVFSAVLSGAQFGMYTGELRADPEKGQNVGFFFGAMDISSFQDVDNFKSRIDQLVNDLKASRKEKDVEEIYMPGELEYLKKEQLSKIGFEIGPGVLRDLINIKEKFNLKNDPRKWEKV